MPATTINEMARATVACYRSEFPGEGLRWTSDWWSEAWSIDGHPGTFPEYLAACQKAWGA